MTSAQNNVEIPSGWGQVRPSSPLNLPSGARVLYQRLEITELIGLGVLDMVDTFTQEVLPKDDASFQAAQKAMAGEIMGDKDRFESVMESIYKIAAKAIVKPEVIYIDPSERKEALPEGKVFAHLIPMEDCIFVFEHSVEGMKDLFRAGEEQADAVADVADGEGDALPSEPTARHRGEEPSVLPEPRNMDVLLSDRERDGQSEQLF